MGILNLFKKKEKKIDKDDVCRLYLNGNITAQELLDACMEKFILCTIEYFRQTEYVLDKIKKHNDDASFIEETAENLATGRETGVPENVQRMLIRYSKQDADDIRMIALTTRDMGYGCMWFLDYERTIGAGLLAKPDPAFDIFRKSREDIIDAIMANTKAYENACRKAKRNTFRNKDGTYTYPEPPSREQLLFLYRLYECLYNVLGLPLEEYADTLCSGEGSKAYEIKSSIWQTKWIPELAPVINPENGQISLPGEDGVFRPVEPDYIAEMVEIDYHGI